MNFDGYTVGYLCNGKMFVEYGELDCEPPMETIETVCIELKSNTVKLIGIEVFQSAKSVIISGIGVVDVELLKLLPNLESVTILKAEVEDLKVLLSMTNLSYVQLDYCNQNNFICRKDNKTSTEYDFHLNLYRKDYKLTWDQYDSLMKVSYNPTSENLAKLVKSSPKFINFVKAHLAEINKEESWLDSKVLHEIGGANKRSRYISTFKRWYYSYLKKLHQVYQRPILKKYILESELDVY